MRRWCIGASDGLGIRKTLIGREELETHHQCVYIANHLSLLDILVLGSFLETDYRWLAKDAVFKVPFLGWHLRIAGHVPVYRGDKRHLNAQLPERLHAVVQEGASLLFFPEGTRSKDGRLQPFKLGAFHAAVDEGLPIVPLVIRGTDALMHKGAKDLSVDRERECSVTVLPSIDPIVPEDGSEDARERAAFELCLRAASAMAAELGQPVPDITDGNRRQATGPLTP